MLFFRRLINVLCLADASYQQNSRYDKSPENEQGDRLGNAGVIDMNHCTGQQVSPSIKKDNTYRFSIEFEGTDRE